MKKGKKINLVVLTIAMAFGCLIVAQVSMAATYPERPVRLIVGFTPGGGSSTISTLMAEKVSLIMEQPMNVEHKPGATGTLAAAYVAKAKPDGYTLFNGTDGPFFIGPLTTPDLPYSLEDFIPIVGYGSISASICVKKGRWNSLKELIADAKKNPGKYTFSSPGLKSTSHISFLMFMEQAGIDLKFVPYLGVSETFAALLGGHIDVTSVGATGGLYGAGRMDILAVAEKERTKLYPNVPTLAELGYPVFVNAYYFLCAPKGTPKEVVGKLYDVHQKVFAKYGSELSDKLIKLEMNPDFLDTEELIEQNKYRMDMFSKILKKMGLLAPNK